MDERRTNEVERRQKTVSVVDWWTVKSQKDSESAAAVIFKDNGHSKDTFWIESARQGFATIVMTLIAEGKGNDAELERILSLPAAEISVLFPKVAGVKDDAFRAVIFMMLDGYFETKRQYRFFKPAKPSRSLGKLKALLGDMDNEKIASTKGGNRYEKRNGLEQH